MLFATHLTISTKRQVALANAMSKPVIRPPSKERSPSVPVERYPYVFDSLAEARSSAAFVQVFLNSYFIYVI